MAEPIVIVKEGSLTIEVRKRRTGSKGAGVRVLRITVPGNFRIPRGAAPVVKKRPRSWKLTWEKP